MLCLKSFSGEEKTVALEADQARKNRLMLELGDDWQTEGRCTLTEIFRCSRPAIEFPKINKARG